MTVSVPPLEEAKAEYNDSWEMCHDMMEDMAEQQEELEKELEEKDDRIEKLEEENEDLREEMEEVKQDQTGQEARLEAVSSRLSNLIDVTLEDSDKLGFDDVEEDNIETRLSDVEESVKEGHDEAPNQGSEAAEDPSTTPMEQLASLPTGMLEDENENVQRAVKIVEGVKQYVRANKTGTGAGYMVTSSEVRKGLERLEENQHPQTVTRVMNSIDELGKDQTTMKKRGGTNRVYIQPDLVKSVQSHRGDGGSGQTPPETVMS